ncbi:SSI family serine proteinase inhibitor [Streptomyces sp. NPDC002644]
MSHLTSRIAARSAAPRGGASRTAALVAVAALGALAVAPAPAAGAPLDDHRLRDRLTVTVRDAGRALDGTYRLRCHPAGGDHPDAAAACARLDGPARATAGDPFAPPAPQVFCTMVDGGPATARITGWWDGRRVNASYDRRDGCGTARWDAMVPVLPEIRAVGGPDRTMEDTRNGG